MSRGRQSQKGKLKALDPIMVKSANGSGGVGGCVDMNKFSEIPWWQAVNDKMKLL